MGHGIKSLTYYDNFQEYDIDDQSIDMLDLDSISGNSDILERLDFLTKQGSTKSYFIFSDFQAIDLQAVDNFQFDSSSIYNLIITQNLNEIRNISIDTLFVNPSQEELSKIIITARFSTWNVGGGNAVIKLMQNSRQLSSIVKDISELNEVQFDLPKSASGDFEIVIDGDEVAYDNTFHFVLSKQTVTRISLINKGNSNVLEVLFNNSKLFLFTKEEVGALDYDELRDEDLIVISGLENIPPSLGNINKPSYLIFPSDSIALRSYEEFLGLNITEVDASEKEIDIDYSHPLMKGIFLSKSNSSDLPKVNSTYRIEGDFETIIPFRDGTPFLLNKGQIYFFNYVLGSESTSFENNALFLPILYQIAFSATGKINQPYFFPRDLITIEHNISDVPIKIKGENYEVIPNFNSNDNEIILEIPIEIRPGKYTVSKDIDTLKMIAINSSRDESIMQSINYDVLRDKFADVDNVNVFKIDDTIYGLNSDTSFNTSIWKYALVLTLFLMLTETLLHRYLE